KLSSIAVAKAMTSQNNPIAFQLRLIVKNKNIIISNSGIIIPAPEPQRIRQTIKTEKLGAKAEINVPRANMLMAVKNNFLVVNFLIRNAVIGIIIPFTSMKIDCRHSTVLSVVQKSRIMSGNAVAINHRFKILVNAPANNIAIIGRFSYKSSES